MSDEDKDKLKVPESDKKTSPLTSRPTSPLINRTIQSLQLMINTAGANLVRNPTPAAASTSATASSEMEDGVQVQNRETDEETEKVETPSSAAKTTRPSRTVIKHDDAKLERLRVQAATRYNRLWADNDHLERVLRQRNPDLMEAQIGCEAFAEDLEEYGQIHSKYTSQLLDNDMTTEYEEEHRVFRSLVREKVKLQTLLKKAQAATGDTDDPGLHGGHLYYHPSMNKPYLDFPKFDGNVRKWLSFWESWKQVDKMKRNDADKYQWLKQMMVPDSDAYKVVDGFPGSGANYTAAKEALKERFGNKKTLIKVYMRDLMKLVMDNARDKPTQSFLDLVTSLTAQVRNLELLGITPSQYGQLLYPVVESCVPESTMEVYLRSPNCQEELEDILKFLNEEVHRKLQSTLARAPFQAEKESTQGGGKSNSKGNNKTPTTTASFLNASGDSREGSKACVFCNKQNHKSVECRKAINMTLDERKEALAKTRACFKCFKVGHGSKQCRGHVKCDKCKKGHNTLMCYGNSRDTPSSTNNENSAGGGSQSQVPNESTPQQVTTTTQMSSYVRKSNVQLQYLKVNIYGTKGYRTVRAMIDSGSQESAIVESLAKELGFPYLGKETKCRHTFGGHVSDEKVYNMYFADISAPGGTDHFTFEVSGESKISGKIPCIPKGEWLKECQDRGIYLTDVGEGPSEVQLMIGGDIELILKKDQQVIHLPSGPFALQTKVGWVLQGKLPFDRMEYSSGAMMCINMHTRSERVEDLWELEAIGITDAADSKSRKEIEEAAMHHFQETVKRDETGRYVVNLPWIESHSSLPDNKFIAQKRLESMTRKLKEEGRLADYDKVFQEWLQEGIIERVPRNDNKGIIHYLPHRAVYKEGSTTPLRPVFDASAKTKTTPSLNQCLEKGPNLLEIIPAILTRFRMNQVGVVADIRKAFLQMKVVDKDRNSLRFLWFSGLGDECGIGSSTDDGCGLDSAGTRRGEIVEFRHCRVVFGVSSSPFLLGATLKHLLENADKHAGTAAKLLKSFYVDNAVISLSSVDSAKQFEVESRALLSPAQFDLRGWEYGPVKDGKIIPVLGLLWNNGLDILQVDSSNLTGRDGPYTKRGILSLANSVYDPLGFLSPFTLNLKLLLKRVWMDEEKYSWDRELSEQYEMEFKRWEEEMAKIHELRIPRYIGDGNQDRAKWSLHVFGDASMEAYATCIFLRIESNPVRVHLFQAKTRVSPKKRVTIPRLELLSCLIGARLCDKVKENMELPDVSVTYWTDSTTALTWINREQIWATFVMNRVSEIRELSPMENWRHIPGESNPADLCSRGCNLTRLINSRWWEGPEWLKLSDSEWPSSQSVPNEDEVAQEKRKTVVSALNIEGESDIFRDLPRYGDFSKILRILAYVRRFCKNVQQQVRSKAQVIPGGHVPEPSVEELNIAENTIVKYVQQEELADPSAFKGLQCKMYEDGILRIETRLTDKGDNFHRPAVLPGKHPLVKLLIWKEHEHNFHAGVQYMQSILREKYWITKSRRSIRRVVHDCSICRRYIAKKCDQDEAPLPLTRTSIVNAFQVIGVDLAGPLFVEKGKKVWICLFTCAVYRAVHLELVSSLSTQSFLEAFDKFICRRGRPHLIYSDNGRNFVGASNLFGKIDMDRVTRHAALKRIGWRHIAPTGSWWGGWWERLIGLMKQLLVRVIGNRRLKQSQLEVLLCEAEAVMNERPLTYISDDPSDLKPLTPAMFIRDIPVTELPETGLMTRLRKMTKLKEEIRSRFRREYLGKLIHHGKLGNKRIQLKPGDVVLVSMDNCKRKDWPVGIVLDVFPGIDGKIRTIKLRTKLGEIIRPIQRLYPLEIMEDKEIPVIPASEG